MCNLRRDLSAVDMRTVIVMELSRESFSKFEVCNRCHVTMKKDKLRDVDLS